MPPIPIVVESCNPLPPPPLPPPSLPTLTFPSSNGIYSARIPLTWSRISRCDFFQYMNPAVPINEIVKKRLRRRRAKRGAFLTKHESKSGLVARNILPQGSLARFARSPDNKGRYRDPPDPDPPDPTSISAVRVVPAEAGSDAIVQLGATRALFADVWLSAV